MSITEKGRAGEAWAREWLKTEEFFNLGDGFFQADWIVEAPDGSYFLVEVKHQEIFRPPPFFGHGLPPYQVEARLRFQKATGIPTLLLVRDAETGEPFWRWLDELDALPDDQKFLTNGPSPRVIYSIEAFRRSDLL